METLKIVMKESWCKKPFCKTAAFMERENYIPMFRVLHDGTNQWAIKYYPQ